MQSAQVYRQVVLENGVEIVARDLTRNYFGDYHLVRLEITFGSSGSGEELHGCDAQKPSFRKVVEKMGVPTCDVEAVKESLVENFLAHSLAYLSAPDFPEKLAASAHLQPKKVKHRYTERRS